MKNKYTDNRLAEIADEIILVRSTAEFPSGTVGLLSKDYTGRGRGFEGLFGKDGKPVALKMNEFRVLRPDNKKDLSRIFSARKIPINAMQLCGAPKGVAVFL